MRQPLGRDFNTDAAFRNMTRPEILKTTGTIINPIKLTNNKRDVQSVETSVQDKRKDGGVGGKRSKAPVSRPEGVKKVKF